jgi:hypothetical protein
MRHTFVFRPSIALAILLVTSAYSHAQGERTVIINLTHSRAVAQRVLNDALVLFPGELHYSAKCYQSALSNYIEAHPAPKSVLDYAEILTPSPENKATISKYLVNCESLNPVAWSIVGVDFPVASQEHPLSEWGGKLEIYKSLIVEELSGELSNDEQSADVSCLNTLLEMTGATWNRSTGSYEYCAGDLHCIETFPQDSKESLVKQLRELREHKCSGAYAYEMVHGSK